MYIIYNILIMVTGILLSPYLIFKIITDKRYRTGIRERLGFVSLPKKGAQRFMVHASSVGEVNVAYPFIMELKSRYEGCDIALTVMTPEGYALAKEKLSGVAGVFFFCIDCSFTVNRYLRRMDPDTVFIVETELWPNFLRGVKKRGIKSAIINGRISEKSLKGYRRMRHFIRPALKSVDLFLMQQDIYKDRLVELLGESKNVKVTGNIKYDINDSFFTVDEELLKNFDALEYIVAASTHDDEERRVLSIFAEIKNEFPEVKLVIAPRHIKRSPSIETLIFENGFSCKKRSDIKNGDDLSSHDVILLDTIGDLVTLFRSAKVVFIGGSLVNVGGHNIIEPAYFATPVIFGEYMHNFSDAKELMLDENAALMVRDEHDLKDKILLLLRDENEQKRLGKAAKEAVSKNSGALNKSMAEIEVLVVR